MKDGNTLNYSPIFDCLRWIVRVILFILICPYIICMFQEYEFFGDIYFVIILVSLSFSVPIINGFLIKNRLTSMCTSFVITPLVIAIALYIYQSNHPSSNWESWFLLAAIFLIGYTAPLWVVASIIFGALKSKKTINSELENPLDAILSPNDL